MDLRIQRVATMGLSTVSSCLPSRAAHHFIFDAPDGKSRKEYVFGTCKFCGHMASAKVGLENDTYGAVEMAKLRESQALKMRQPTRRKRSA